jgi:uncharacterized protein YndB with AHSA1/START domain
MANDALVAHSSTVIAASPDLIWRALVDPVAIKRYMFGTTVTSDWTEGGDIIWEGEWQGRPYRDHGKVLRIEPDQLLEYTHFSPLAGKPDVPENYHTVTIRLAVDIHGTEVTLAQDGNDTEEERRHSEKNWDLMLAGLKEYVEQP